MKYIKDLSVEIPSPDVFIFSKEFITKYTLGINVTTEPMKNSMLEVITKLHYKDPSENKRKSYFEISLRSPHAQAPLEPPLYNFSKYLELKFFVQVYQTFSVASLVAFRYKGQIRPNDVTFPVACCYKF